MSDNNKLRIGITQGDTNGVGYEVIIKCLSDARLLDMCTPIVYGSSKAFGYYRKQLCETENIVTNVISSAREAHQKRVNIVNCVPDMPIEPGQLTHEGSKAAIAALEKAVEEMKEGLIDVLVTAPFNKRAVNQETFKFPSHTDYLAKEFGNGNGVMLMCANSMRIGFVTNHLPVSKISSSLASDAILDKLRVLNSSLKRDFCIVKPKIAVLGLNPHAGDNGFLGDEETNIIRPAIEQANSEGILAFGPYSPDGFFSINMQYRFDAVLAMYHDQGLIPFKSLAFDSGVNFTAGLSIVRTGPDHGSAFDLAGKNKANPQSMMSAIYMAIDIWRNRVKYDRMNANPMPIKEFESSKDKPGRNNIA